jgi:hypothetical protein
MGSIADFSNPLKNRRGMGSGDSKDGASGAG